VAKAEDIETTGDEPFRVAGARIVRTRADELFAQAAGVLDVRDIERVHDMRVASRRLRAVLEIFAPCFPPREYASVLKDVKALADALGERRDPDVHIDALTAFARALTPAQRSGVQVLIAEQRDRQAAGNEVLAAALARMEERGLRERLHALADAAAGAGAGEDEEHEEEEDEA
jgi:CHAD domain-containing protein